MAWRHLEELVQQHPTVTRRRYRSLDG